MSSDEDKGENLDSIVENNIGDIANHYVDDEKYSRLKLYVSCALSFWGDRMWFFAMGLFFHYMNPNNFLMAAIYGLSNRLCMIIFCGPIGRWIDRSPRFRAATLFLFIQNSSVIMCTACLVAILLTKALLSERLYGLFLFLGQSLMLVFASIGSIASISSAISVQRDWVKVISGDNKELLAAMNTIIRCIDLTSSFLAPIAGGYLIVVSPIFGALFLAGWNVISFFLEYWLLRKVYEEVPRLVIKPMLDSTENSNPVKCSERIIKFLKKHFGGWQIYWNQEILLAGLGFAYLYMTVLVFDSITIAYSTSQGVPENIMGTIVAAGGISGVLGTIAYPYLRKCVGLDFTGFMGFTLETMFLSMCVISVWCAGSPFDLSYIGLSLKKLTNSGNVSSNFASIILDKYSFKANKVEHITIMKFNRTLYQSTPSSYLSISLLLSGIILSRFGLWIADLSVHQEIQELVDGRELGSVCGIQSSLNQTFSLLKFILVAVIRWKETFGILVILSFLFVFFGWVSYTLFLRRRIASQRPKKSYELDTDNEF